jgi:hypothetical protein
MMLENQKEENAEDLKTKSTKLHKTVNLEVNSSLNMTTAATSILKNKT